MAARLPGLLQAANTAEATVAALQTVLITQAHEQVGQCLGDIVPPVEQRVVDPPKTIGKPQWRHTFAKFWVAQMYEFDSVAVLDYDVLLLKPLDVMFELADEIPDSVVSPRAYWLRQPCKVPPTIHSLDTTQKIDTS